MGFNLSCPSAHSRIIIIIIMIIVIMMRIIIVLLLLLLLLLIIIIIIILLLLLLIGGVIGWTKKELQSMDRKTRNVMTMNKELHSRSDTARIYVPSKRDDRGLKAAKVVSPGKKQSGLVCREM